MSNDNETEAVITDDGCERYKTLVVDKSGVSEGDDD